MQSWVQVVASLLIHISDGPTDSPLSLGRPFRVTGPAKTMWNDWMDASQFNQIELKFETHRGSVDLWMEILYV